MLEASETYDSESISNYCTVHDWLIVYSCNLECLQLQFRVFTAAI